MKLFTPIQNLIDESSKILEKIKDLGIGRKLVTGSLAALMVVGMVAPTQSQAFDFGDVANAIKIAQDGAGIVQGGVNVLNTGDKVMNKVDKMSKKKDMNGKLGSVNSILRDVGNMSKTSDKTVDKLGKMVGFEKGKPVAKNAKQQNYKVHPRDRNKDGRISPSEQARRNSKGIDTKNLESYGYGM